MVKQKIPKKDGLNLFLLRIIRMSAGLHYRRYLFIVFGICNVIFYGTR